MRHLILNLEAPLMAFGGEIIDNYGVIRQFPSASMLTGLLANALGWRRTEAERHQQLQDRLVFAARIDREPAGGVRLIDFQTAQLGAKDSGWTTRGEPEGRAGGAATYEAPHLRYRDYFADMYVTVALRLHPADGEPTLEKLAEVIQQPARPLFIGRKPCLPSVPLFKDFAEGDAALTALLDCPLSDETLKPATIRVQWPEGEGMEGIEPTRRYMLTDQRNWVSGLHGGGRAVYEGGVEREMFKLGGDPTPPDKEQP